MTEVVSTATEPDPGDGGGGSDKSFTQADVDRIVQDRLRRAETKYADYDDLKTKASKYDEIEANSKTELDKANDRAAAAERRAEAAELERQEARLDRAVLTASSTHGIVDPDAAVRLLDRSEVTYDKDGKPDNIDALLTKLVEAKPYLVGKGVTKPDLGQGARGNGGGTDMNSLIRERMRR